MTLVAVKEAKHSHLEDKLFEDFASFMPEVFLLKAPSAPQVKIKDTALKLETVLKHSNG
jgi:hypothetical protein